MVLPHWKNLSLPSLLWYQAMNPSTEPDGYDDKMDDSCAMVSPEHGSLLFDYDHPLGKSTPVKKNAGQEVAGQMSEITHIQL